jgi:hypothetical protein
MAPSTAAKAYKEKKVDTAEYIASMCDELAGLAERNGFDTGAYLLRVALLEFAKQQEHSKPTLRK